MQPVVVRCQGLIKDYGELRAVDGLDLEVRPGECFGLLGPNGAGKTTTVEVLEGLLQPDGGAVELFGIPWAGNGPRLRQRLGIQLQESRFIENQTVLETVTLFRSFYQAGLEPHEALRIVDLEEKARAWVRKLSGGQLQRLSLACALVSEPELLFLDEPTTGLDPQSRRQTWEIVRARQASGTTILLTTHYMEEAERLCDRVAIMDHGRIIASGTPRELIASLGAEHCLEIETETEPDEAQLRELEGVRSLAREGGQLRLIVDHPHRAVPRLLAELERQRVELSRLTTHHATLEDVFVELTGRHLRDE